MKNDVKMNENASEKQELKVANASLRDEEVCPECGSSGLQRVGRCKTCHFCGWSACNM